MLDLNKRFLCLSKSWEIAVCAACFYQTCRLLSFICSFWEQDELILNSPWLGVSDWEIIASPCLTTKNLWSGANKKENWNPPTQLGRQHHSILLLIDHLSSFFTTLIPNFLSALHQLGVYIQKISFALYTIFLNLHKQQQKVTLLPSFQRGSCWKYDLIDEKMQEKTLSRSSEEADRYVSYQGCKYRCCASGL